MFFTQHDGLGQDQEMVRMRRRPMYMALIAIAVMAVCLLAAFFLLREGHGSLLVMVDQPGAVIMLNGALMPNPPGTLIKGLRADTYNVTVSKPGFVPEPASQIIKLHRGDTAELSFIMHRQLIPPPKFEAPPLQEPQRKAASTTSGETHQNLPTAIRPQNPRSEAVVPVKPIVREAEKTATPPTLESLQGALHITTQPNKGGIYVDEVFKGNGQVDLTELKLGELVVRFTDLDGYRTPGAQKVFLSPDKPSAQVEGLYLPLVFISAGLEGSGRTVTQKSSIVTGYLIGENPPHPDPITGPEVKYLEETRSFAWEIGYAFPNRNPPGQDFIEFSFNLPERFDGVKPLELRLYGFASDKRYPFTASGRCGYDVLVNDRSALQNALPGTKLGQSGTGFDAVPVNNYLKSGPNIIRIQSSSASRCYYYLSKIVLL
jgi:hypothetical protein